jgi:hypothetical protein
MADEHLFTADVAAPPTEKRRSGWQNCFIGCLIVCVILFVLLALVAFWISRNWRDWIATGGTEGIRQAMLDSQLPPQEQQEIMVQVDRVATAFRDKQVSAEQLGVLAEKLMQSPLMSAIVASTIDRQYLAKSNLSEEEKTEDRRTLQRFVRGVIDKKIDEQGLDAAMTHVADRDRQGHWQLKKQLTDEELRAFFAEAKRQADDAGIPAQPAEIDPSEEVKKIVDAALATPAEQPPPGDESDREM